MEDILRVEYLGHVIRIVPDTDPMHPRKEFDNVGKMVCWHGRYALGDEQPSASPTEYLWNLAEEVMPSLMERLTEKLSRLKAKVDFVEFKQYMEDLKEVDEWGLGIVDAVIRKHYILLPLYLYDHSGITISTGSFGDPWDSGQVGFIYVSREQSEKEWAWSKEYGSTEERAIAYLKGEVKTYDDFLTGSVFGHIIEKLEFDEDGEPVEGEEVDSCWGHWPDDAQGFEAQFFSVICEAKSTIEHAVKNDFPLLEKMLAEAIEDGNQDTRKLLLSFREESLKRWVEQGGQLPLPLEAQ